MSKRKFLFLYLNTGAGHKSAAKVLAESMKKLDPSVEIQMRIGYSRHGIGHLIFEKGYNYSLNIFRGLFPLIYDLGQHRWLQSLLNYIIGPEARHYLRKLILKEKPTDIVSFHFGVTPFVKDVLKNIPWNINFHVIVTDPFTVPKCWFYEKNLQYMVYSEEAKRTGVKECGIPPENIKVIPFLMNPKYTIKLEPEEIQTLKIKHGFDPKKKIVLLIGGGEGLPGATEIINQCILRHPDFAIAIICGRNKVSQKNMNILRLAHPRLDLHVYGFVDYLDELVKICDCAVIKAGPATLMEVLSCRKPVIICRYIHNQELGNMRFAVNNHVGYFIQKSKKIYEKINEILSDKNFDSKMKKNFDEIRLDSDSSKVAKILLSPVRNV